MDGFNDALEAIDRIIAAERADPAIDPVCTTQVFHGDVRAERALVLLHGFTNCPRQFVELGRRFADRGFTVYIPRLPRHGMRDKMTTALHGLTADELKMCGAQAVQLAAALGQRVSVLGLSVGGTLAAWIGATHAVEAAVALAPFFSIGHVAQTFEPALTGALLLAPNADLWWDPRVRERIPPPHAYPRFPTHALAQSLLLGESVHALARTAVPLAARSVLAINAKDPAVDNAAAQAVWALWRAHGGAVTEHVFNDVDARHDIIEPTTYPDARRLVYPILESLV